jgi:hypothetical protein
LAGGCRGKQTEGKRVRLQQAMRCDAMRCRDTTVLRYLDMTGDSEWIVRQKTAGSEKR